MGDVNLPLGATNSGVNDWSDVAGEVGAIVDVVNGGIDNDNIDASAAITYSKLSLTNGIVAGDLTSGSVTAAKLAADTQAQYKTLLCVASESAFTPGTGTRMFAAGTSIAQSAATTGTAPLLFDYTSGDYSFASLTTKFRVKLEVAVGGTSPSTVTFTAGLYPLTISAGAYTMGTVVTGSTALSSGLSTNTISRFNSGDFAASALLTNPGPYVLGVVIGSITVPAGIGLNIQLQTRNV